MLVISDGAGGLAGGAEAAETVVRSVEAKSFSKPEDVVRHLIALDDALFRSPTAGEATAVIAIELNGQVFGASVGDSQLLAVADEEVVELTESQRRKPLLGTGSSRPVPLELAGARCVVLTTDGVHKYAALNALQSHELLRLEAEDLIERARLPNGELQDHASAIVWRLR